MPRRIVNQEPSKLAQALSKRVEAQKEAESQPQAQPQSNVCPKCGSMLRESKKGWMYCPKRNWDNPSAGCQFKGFMKRTGLSDSDRPKDIASLTTASEEQLAIFAAGQELLESDYKGLLAIARAGVGKTTVLVQLARIWHEQHLTTMLLCFAKRDRLAMESRIPSHYAKIKTSNGAGLSILTDYARQSKIGRIELNDKMSEQILYSRLREDGLIPPQGVKGEWQIHFRVISAIKSAVDSIRTVKLMVHPYRPTDQDFLDVLEQFNVEYEPSEESTILHYASFLFNEMASLKSLAIYGVDFCGQVFLPIYHNLSPSQRYDRVAVDEVQDQNVYNRMLAFKFVDPKGSLIAVGDEHQAIYEWRGASSNAVNEIQRLMEERGLIQTLPLTLCRRCAKKVIGYAQKLVPDIQALPDADEGTSREIPTEEQLFAELRERRKGLVICRANGPLVSLCLKLLAQGVPAVLARSNIIAQLLTLIDSLSERNDDTAVTDLLEKAQLWLEDQYARATRRLDGENIARIAKDKYDCIVALSSQQELRVASDVKRKIQSLFPSPDEVPDPASLVLLSTVHGAKGGEAHTVYLFSPEGRDFSIFDAVWSSARDRDNTLYVAVTRCEQELVFVGPMPTFKRFSEKKGGEEQEIDSELDREVERERYLELATEQERDLERMLDLEDRIVEDTSPVHSPAKARAKSKRKPRSK